MFLFLLARLCSKEFFITPKCCVYCIILYRIASHRIRCVVFCCVVMCFVLLCCVVVSSLVVSRRVVSCRINAYFKFVVFWKSLTFSFSLTGFTMGGKFQEIPAIISGIKYLYRLLSVDIFSNVLIIVRVLKLFKHSELKDKTNAVDKWISHQWTYSHLLVIRKTLSLPSYFTL